jgi:membrane-associated protein
MIHEFLNFIRTLTTPEGLIQLLSAGMSGWLGYALLTAIVFAETGLLVGFVLPGDSLLFTIGVVAGLGHLNIAVIIVLLISACMLGDWSGYLLGRRTGTAVFQRRDSRFFKQEYLQRTHDFYEKHGGKTIIYAKFVPIIRTFAPFVAGVGRMRYARFASFDIFGAIGWVCSMTLLGFFLGRVDFVRQHFEKFVLLVILVSVSPMIYHVIKARLNKNEAVREESASVQL